jgi:hypothetical protein
LDPQILPQLLDYNRETGELFWKARSTGLFASGNGQSQEQSANAWNAKYAGKPAFTANSNGYRRGAIFGKLYDAHIVCWTLANGEWPKDEIDHENHVRSYNAESNLKSATRKQNAKNHSLGKRNTSGNIGVHWNAQNQKWRARIWVNSKHVDLGCHSTKELAIEAVRVGYAANGYHPNHGNPLQNAKEN